MKMPSLKQMVDESETKLRFNYEVAYYNGYMAALDAMHREHGDDPAIAETIKTMAAYANADMAAILGG